MPTQAIPHRLLRHHEAFGRVQPDPGGLFDGLAESTPRDLRRQKELTLKGLNDYRAAD
jgi:hypothetical protein